MSVAGATLGLSGCGVQEHPQPGQGAVSVATGGTTNVPPVPGTGGQGLAGTGGVVGGASTGGSTGSVAGTGGTPASASGGSPGSGGNTVVTGTGGRGTGTGGAAPGTGGATGTGTGGSVGTGGRVGTGGAVGSGGAVGTGGAPVSGITVNIGGTLVPKEKAIVFIHFGHSNMQGLARSPTTARPYFYTPQPGLWIYRGANTFVPAMEPTAPSSTRDMGAGPGMALLKVAAAAAPADHHFISIGRGQGSAPSPDYLKGAILYPTVMTRAMELKGKVTFGAIFVMLGITERHLPAAQQPAFPMRIQQIIASMRADLGEPNLPVLFCDYEMEATATLAPTGPVGTFMIPLIRSLPSMITNFTLVPTEGLGMQDDHHFNFDGQRVWSERAIGLMQTRGWFPWRR